MSMRTRHNSIAEKLWYVIREAIEAGVTIEDFRIESRECWVEAHREAAQFAIKEFNEKLGR